jgi:hypothetical protein
MWKSVIVRPVVKVASSCRSDFHPITIVSVVSKGLERLINGQVLAHVDRSGLLSEFQSGFRCGHSTTTALVRVIEDLRSSMTEKKVTLLVLLDFSKAFDCLDHPLFLHKLVSLFDFHGSARNMVPTFLNCRSMVVNVDGARSSPRTLFSGVPQGFVPSSLFFMFVNCLSERIRHSKFHYYADDLQIYLSGNRSDLDGLIARMHKDVEAIHR